MFLSTEAGGTGLNLQAADILINFELPWNPAKKNQRIGRIDRIGQKSDQLTVFNLITRNSIEQQIASGLLVKQSLFDGVLGDDTHKDFIDFTTKGRSQFIKQVEEMLSNLENEEEIINDESENIELPEESHDIPDIEKNTIDLTSDDIDDENTALQSEANISEKTEREKKLEEMKTVMHSGMNFLAGMYKMSTGKEIGIDDQKLDINTETGEITMKFKIPL